MVNFEIQDGLVIPYINYDSLLKNLKKYRKEKSEIKQEDFFNLVKFLFSTIERNSKKRYYSSGY